MGYFAKNESTNKNLFIHLYANVSLDELNPNVDAVFTSSGYQLKDGEPGNGTYVRGNRTMRILFGAFIKYFKYNVFSEVSGTGIRLSVVLATSGMSGGLIGMNQVKKESTRLSEALSQI